MIESKICPSCREKNHPQLYECWKCHYAFLDVKPPQPTQYVNVQDPNVLEGLKHLSNLHRLSLLIGIGGMVSFATVTIIFKGKPISMPIFFLLGIIAIVVGVSLNVLHRMIVTAICPNCGSSFYDWRWFDLFLRNGRTLSSRCCFCGIDFKGRLPQPSDK